MGRIVTLRLACPRTDFWSGGRAGETLAAVTPLLAVIRRRGGA
jgi:hypothetical protein